MAQHLVRKDAEAHDVELKDQKVYRVYAERHTS